MHKSINNKIQKRKQEENKVKQNLRKPNKNNTKPESVYILIHRILEKYKHLQRLTMKNFMNDEYCTNHLG